MTKITEFCKNQPPLGLPAVTAQTFNPLKTLADKVGAFFGDHFGKLTLSTSLTIGIPLCILGGHVGIAIGIFVIGIGIITCIVEAKDSTIPV